MKVKDLERTANIAWSPASINPIYLAAGTAAQQLDASFSTNAALELYTLNLTDPGTDLELRASIPSEQRFHKLIWGPHNNEESGTIVGGCDNGIIKIYNASQILKQNTENALISQQNKHSGPVHSLDFNIFQHNLLASGATESEIYIWDLNNMKNAMTPGAKSQPLEDVLSIQWNKQVQHILASTFSSKCVVWDLRKNEPIIKLSDTQSRIRWKVVAWHPEVATQLCLASEEDQAPVVQLWDLRFATTPLKTLESHQRGITAMAWSSADPDLLVTAGKDLRLVCWDPNGQRAGGEVLAELARTNQWCSDVQWCPGNPALVAVPCFDGHVSVYSIMGGKTQQIQTTNKIADSFPGMDDYAQAPILQEQTGAATSVDLTKAPKWMKRPVGASFGFGGKLISFDHDKQAIAQSTQNLQPGEIPLPISRCVFISQVVTENELIFMSNQLEQALEYGNFTEYCRNKADSTTDQHKKYIWHFLKANFEEDYRNELLNLLGYGADDVNTKLYEFIGVNNVKNNLDNLTDQFSSMNRGDFSDGENNLSSNGSGDYSPGDSIPDQFANISQNYTEKKPPTLFKIQTSDDLDGLITQAILLGNIDAATELCLKAKRYADALVIAKTGGNQLFEATQAKYLEQSEGTISSLICSLVSEDWTSVIENCDISSWKEALVAALSHTTNNQLPKLCELMGNRLEAESAGNPKYIEDAQLCFICAGSFEKLVSSWSGKVMKSTHDLQELVELVTFLQKAVEKQGRTVEITGNLATLLSNYASLLAAQGNLTTALSYLGSSTSDTSSHLLELRERLYVTLGHSPYNAVTASQLPQRTRTITTGSVHSVASARNSFSSYPSQFGTGGGVPSTAMYGQAAAPPPIVPAVPVQQQSGGWQSNATGGGGYPAPLGVSGQMPPGGGQFPPLPGQPMVNGAMTQPPPRPTSVGSNQGSGPSSRSKYLLDPSVQSNPYTPQPIANTPRQFAPAPLSTPYHNTPGPVQSYNNTPMMAHQPPSSMFTPSAVGNNTAPVVPPVQQFIPSAAGMGQVGGYPPGGGGGMQEQSLPPPPPMGGQQAAAHGWNDPPVFNRKVATKQPEHTAPPQQPVTHPIFGTAPLQQPSNGYLPQQHQQPPPMGGVQHYPLQDLQQPMYQPQQQTNNIYQPQGQQQQQPQAFVQPGGFNTQAVVPQASGQQGQDVGVPSGLRRTEREPVVPKGPIPEEHIHMQTVLDELRSRCAQAASNPQIKRKIDDVSKKLEALYDLLREHRLSPNTLTMLHDMVKLIQYGDYAGGLNIHMQLVSGPDFSQIASFMPGLKVLLQCATQLQVFLN